MKQLTDSMIEKALKNELNNDTFIWVIIFLFGLATILGLFAYYGVTSKSQRNAGIVAIVVLVLLGIEYICQYAGTNYIIKRSAWVVDTDVVEKVAAYTDDGERKYYMILEKYGRVSLDGYEYRSGDEVYVVLFPSYSLLSALNGEYVTKGEVYSTDTYIYVGTHSLK